MKRGFKTAGLALMAGFLAFPALPVYGAEAGLSEEEFAKVCEDNHADESRYFLPPLKSPEAEAERLNYEYHYRRVLMMPNGSFEDNPYDTSRVQILNQGDIWMDLKDGYEVSYEYHLEAVDDPPGAVTVVEGKEITPYYRAVPLNDGVSLEEQVYEYIPIQPAEVPIIPDYPQNYDWKSHGDQTLRVSAYVTVRSAVDGKETSFESNIGYVTNLYKDTPDCYSLRPTDRAAYTVQKGDCLYKIAESFYGSGDDWIYILERNREWIPNASLLRPEMLLILPNVESY